MHDLIATESPHLDRARRIGLPFIFLWFLIGGIAHFVATDTEVRLVPPYIPSPLAAVWVSGVFELLGAGGLLFTATRRSAGIGLFALSICVTPVHIYMLQRPDLFTVPYWALLLRLPLQVALLALIAWSMFRKARAQQTHSGQHSSLRPELLGRESPRHARRIWPLPVVEGFVRSLTTPRVGQTVHGDQRGQRAAAALEIRATPDFPV